VQVQKDLIQQEQVAMEILVVAVAVMAVGVVVVEVALAVRDNLVILTITVVQVDQESSVSYVE
jgi:1,4-dihydroxy-2-naphthoate octaprenyltransferase